MVTGNTDASSLEPGSNALSPRCQIFLSWRNPFSLKKKKKKKKKTFIFIINYIAASKSNIANRSIFY